MSLMRINDLARELEVKSREILESLPDLGIQGKRSHSSSLEGDQVALVRAYFDRGFASQPRASSDSAREPPRRDAPLNPRYRFDTFVVGGSNELAQAAAERVAKDPARSYNPLFLYGGVGLGKTHLMHAIGNEMQRRLPHWRICYVSAERFMNEMIQSLKEDSMASFRNWIRNVDALLVDDVQILARGERTQEEFCHAFDTLYEARKQIVLSSDCPPKMIAVQERLRSRFERGLVAEIQPPEVEVRRAILLRKAEEEGFALPGQVAMYIAEHVKSNGRVLEGCMLRLIAHCAITNELPTEAIASHVLKNLLSGTDMKVRLQDEREELLLTVAVLDSQGKLGEAIDELKAALERMGPDPGLTTLITQLEAKQKTQKATEFAAQLKDVSSEINQAISGGHLDQAEERLKAAIATFGKPVLPSDATVLMEARERLHSIRMQRAMAQFQADREEEAGCQTLQKLAFDQARGHITKAIQIDHSRGARLQDEFGFLLDARAGSTQADAARLHWCAQIWLLLADRNRLVLPDAGLSSTVRDPEPIQVYEREQRWRCEDSPGKIRRQKRGTQDGFDLSIEWSAKLTTNADRPARCHVECKNYTSAVTMGMVGEKLLSEPWRTPAIDHWILISPRANPANELNYFLENQEKENRFPFRVQVWCPETGIEEFFGLEPEVYNCFFTPANGEAHPSNWSDEYRESVRARWRERLNAPLRLPESLGKYLRDPRLICIHKEIPDEMEKCYATHVPVRCRTLNGPVLEGTLETRVREWLRSETQVLFLLGEFGDGKSFFTYTLARRLIEELHLTGDSGWLPLRLALGTFPRNGSVGEFLRQRLEKCGASVADWYLSENVTKRLIILDGFDEISVELDPAAVTANIKTLLECVDEFEGCKIIITSRTHFFQNRGDVQRLFDRLGHPVVYHLAPISRAEVINHLSKTAPSATAQEVLDRVRCMNDPIGLASKPLFLEMLEDIVADTEMATTGPRQELNVVVLYERYIHQSLKRKSRLLEDRDLVSRPEETIANLRNILGEVAVSLQRTNKDYFVLDRFQSASQKRLAELLWRLSGEEKMEADATSRVGARSLLARVFRSDLEDKAWPVDFCHRSMREYFVAIGLCEAVEADGAAGEEFLKEIRLNHEILDFAAERWRATDAGRSRATERLLALLPRAAQSNDPGRLGGYLITLLYRLNRGLPKDADWTNKVFDGADLEDADLSGMNFSGCSFRSANLTNVNFEKTKFTYCDFTGVRVEAAAQVVSICLDESRENLIGAYRNNVLRKWVRRPGRGMGPTYSSSVPIAADVTMGFHVSGQFWMRNGGEMFFLVPEKDGWKVSTRFRVKDSIREAHSRGDLATLIETNEDGTSQLVLIDLARQVRVTSFPVRSARRCIAIGTWALAWCDAVSGVRVRRLAGDDPQELVLECIDPLCLDVTEGKGGKYLLAAGTGTGQAIVWELDTNGNQFCQKQVFETKAHEGQTTSIAFRDDETLATGGADRSIALITLRQDYGRRDNVERLRLSLNCSEMKIDGLHPETVRDQLKALISESKAS